MKNFFTILFLLFLYIPISGQDKEAIDPKEYFLDAEYFLAEEEYLDALYDYQELYNNGFKDNANINYRIGICYLNIPGQKDKSISYLLEAVKNVAKKYKENSLKQISAPVDAWLFLGNAYRVNNQLAKAIESYNKYKELATSQAELSYADQQIVACNIAIRFMDSPLQIRSTSLGDSINGASSNYKAVVSGNGLTLAYMNELPFYTAVFVSHYTPEGWLAPVNITPQIQSDGDQFVTSISYDGTRLYLTKEDGFNSDIYVSNFQKGKWTKSIPVTGQDINTKYWESHASISANGKTLYFTSNRTNGIGDMDIYRSQLLNNGEWGPAENMGSVINTRLNEDTPFITDNDSILYFSSQGHETMGGYDIFRSLLQQGGAWSAPENIRYPLNSTDDDLFFFPWRNGRVLYASFIKPDGFGKEDIYALQPAEEESLTQLLGDLVYPKAKPQVPALALTQPAVPEVAPAVSPAAEPVAEPAVTPVAEPAVTPAAEPAAVPAVTPVAEPAVAPAAEPAAVPAVTPVAEPAVAPAAEPADTPAAPPVAEPAVLQLDRIYFGFDNAQLTDQGKAVLNQILDLLNSNTALKLKLLGHADAKGSDEYNRRLSQKRAEEAMRYLAARGIPVSRLSSLGLGEKEFVAINSNADGSDSPEGRYFNRRVEYEITGVDHITLRIILPPIPENLRIRE